MPFENSIADSKISKFTRSEVGDRRLAHSQTAFSCLYYRQEMVHCTIYACIDIDKRSSYLLALMSQVKAFNTLSNSGHYIITLRSAFGQTNEVGYSPLPLIL